jgi:hypothetical protein
MFKTVDAGLDLQCQNRHFLRKMQKGNFLIENTDRRFAFEDKETGRALRQLSVIEVGNTANALDAVMNF